MCSFRLEAKLRYYHGCSGRLLKMIAIPFKFNQKHMFNNSLYFLIAFFAFWNAKNRHHIRTHAYYTLHEVIQSLSSSKYSSGRESCMKKIFTSCDLKWSLFLRTFLLKLINNLQFVFIFVFFSISGCWRWQCGSRPSSSREMLCTRCSLCMVSTSPLRCGIICPSG